MKFFLGATLSIAFSFTSFHLSAQTAKTSKKDQASPKVGTTHLFIDVHRLEPGKVSYEAVAGAHKKDLAIQNKYGVNFKKFWIDEEKGMVYCLSSASDSESIRKTHAEAHGLLPEHVHLVTDGAEAALSGHKDLFLDIHELGAGAVNAEAVANAHKKDLAIQKKYGVNLINYWVNEKQGIVMCLAEAKDSNALISTHTEAHGLIPTHVMKVKQGD